MSLSSVEDDEPKAMKSGNAQIHGMTHITAAWLAYIATQVFHTEHTLFVANSLPGSLCPMLFQYILSHQFHYQLANIL
jgi:hypothetical protein